MSIFDCYVEVFRHTITDDGEIDDKDKCFQRHWTAR